MDFNLNKPYHLVKKRVKGHKRWNPRKGRYDWVRTHRRKKLIRGKHID